MATHPERAGQCVPAQASRFRRSMYRQFAAAGENPEIFQAREPEPAPIDALACRSKQRPRPQQQRRRERWTRFAVHGADPPLYSTPLRASMFHSNGGEWRNRSGYFFFAGGVDEGGVVGAPPDLPSSTTSPNL